MSKEPMIGFEDRMIEWLDTQGKAVVPIAPQLDSMFLYVAGLPRSKGSLKVVPGRRPFESNLGVRQWMKAVGKSALGRTRKIMTGPVAVTVLFYLGAPPASDCRIIRQVRPDLDKLARAIFDALTGVVFVDDAQVVDLHAVKAWSDPPGCHIVVTPFNNACPHVIHFRQGGLYVTQNRDAVDRTHRSQKSTAPNRR